MDTIEEYDEVEVIQDINPTIHAGMVGLVVEKGELSAEVVFTSSTGKTYQFEGESSFWIPVHYLKRALVA